MKYFVISMLNIETLKEKIVENLMPLNVKKIILFGSYAYGTPIEDSDLDICVVEKEYANKWNEKRIVLWSLKIICYNRAIKVKDC